MQHLPRVLSIVLILSFAVLPVAARAQAGVGPTDEERDQAVIRALHYLQEKVTALPDIGGSPRKQFTTATWGLVLLLVQDERKYKAAVPDAAEQLRKVMDYVTAYVAEVERRSRDPKQLPSKPGMLGTNSIIQYNWPLGVTALFLAEAHERNVLKAEAKALLARVVTILHEAQQENGGWGHGLTSPQGEPSTFGIDGYPDTLVAAADLVGAAVGVGYKVLKVKEKAGLEEAAQYFSTAQLDNGNFPYDPSQRSAQGDSTGAGRTAGAVFALAAMGVRLDSPTIQKGARYIQENMADLSEGHGSAALNLLYGALACHLLQGEYWTGFERKFFRPILQHQMEDGSFECICEGRVFGSTNDSKGLAGMSGFGGGAFEDGTTAYVTALHTWILLLDSAKPKYVPGGKAGATTGGK